MAKSIGNRAWFDELRPVLFWWHRMGRFVLSDSSCIFLPPKSSRHVSFIFHICKMCIFARFMLVKCDFLKMFE